MKNTNIKVIAAAAVMSAFMFTGCADQKNVNNTTAESKVSATVDKADAPMPVETKTIETKAVESKIDESSKHEASRKTDAQPAESKPAVNVKAINDNTSKAEESAKKAEAAAHKAEEAKKAAPVQVKTGTFFEQSQGEATMDIFNNGDSTYSVHVEWPVNDNEYNEWDVIGQFDDKGVLTYNNCYLTSYAYDINGKFTYTEDGVMAPFIRYTNGSGSFEIKDYGVVWNDNMGDIIKGTTFGAVKPSKPAKTETKTETKTADTTTKTNKLNTGLFTEATGLDIDLSVTKITEDKYDCTVMIYSGGKYCETYSFICNGNGCYDYAVQDMGEYQAGALVKDTFISSAHSGTLSNTANGLVWNDSDGTTYTFVSADSMDIPNAGPSLSTISANSYFDANGAKVTLDVSLMSNGTYFCAVTQHESYNSAREYNFICEDYIGSLIYECGTYNQCIYDENGFETREEISAGHSGSITLTEDGLVWADSDGTSYTFVTNSMI